MERSLFTELNNAEQESLSGGRRVDRDLRFDEDDWDCYSYYSRRYGNYYVCYRDNDHD